MEPSTSAEKKRATCQRYRARHRALGLCEICPRHSGAYRMCLMHRIQAAAYQRARLGAQRHAREAAA